MFDLCELRPYNYRRSNNIYLRVCRYYVFIGISFTNHDNSVSLVTTTSLRLTFPVVAAAIRKLLTWLTYAFCFQCTTNHTVIGFRTVLRLPHSDMTGHKFMTYITLSGLSIINFSTFVLTHLKAVVPFLILAHPTLTSTTRLSEIAHTSSRRSTIQRYKKTQNGVDLVVNFKCKVNLAGTRLPIWFHP